jgi:DNA-binding phage protein
MSKKINVSELPEFDATKYLSSEEDIAAYLTAVVQENDSALLLQPCGTLRVRGVDTTC